jgi:hypothetical protein
MWHHERNAARLVTIDYAHIDETRASPLAPGAL